MRISANFQILLVMFGGCLELLAAREGIGGFSRDAFKKVRYPRMAALNNLEITLDNRTFYVT